MKTNCKKWKHLLFITAAAITFASIPFYTLAADANTKELDGTDKKQEATSDKMDSEEDPVTTAGAADLLDAEITQPHLPKILRSGSKHRLQEIQLWNAGGLKTALIEYDNQSS